MTSPLYHSMPAVHSAASLESAGHAVAYLSIGRNFKYLSAAEGRIVGNGKPIDQWDEAVISMAGPAVEAMMYHYGRGGGDARFTAGLSV